MGVTIIGISAMAKAVAKIDKTKYETILLFGDYIEPKFYKEYNTYLVGKRTLYGHGTGNILEQGRLAFEESKKGILDLIHNDYVIVVCGLSRGMSGGLVTLVKYLIDNGCYIYLFIFNHIEGNFYYDMFGVQTYEEAKDTVTNLDEENQSDINQRILNIVSQLRKENGGYFQPLRLFFFEESGIANPILANLLKEDKLDEYDNYPGYLCNLHREIQERIED